MKHNFKTKHLYCSKTNINFTTKRKHTNFRFNSKRWSSASTLLWSTEVKFFVLKIQFLNNFNVIERTLILQQKNIQISGSTLRDDRQPLLNLRVQNENSIEGVPVVVPEGETTTKLPWYRRGVSWLDEKLNRRKDPG